MVKWVLSVPQTYKGRGQARNQVQSPPGQVRWALTVPQAQKGRGQAPIQVQVPPPLLVVGPPVDELFSRPHLAND